MSNQPAPTRPWFRLASMSGPAPASTPEPAPALPRPDTIRFRPAFRPPTRAQPNAAAPPPPAASVPPSPIDKKPTVPTTSPAKTAATSSLPPSSAAKPVVTNTTENVSPAKGPPTATSVASFPTQKPASSVTTTTRMPSPISSLTKPPTGRPPSPSTLSPFHLKAQAEIDPKKIQAEAEQKTIDNPKGWLFGGTRKAASKGSEAKGKQYSLDSEDAGMRIITITGDNKGAHMDMNPSSHHKNGSQGTPFRLENSNSSEAGDRKMKAKSNTSKTMPMNAFSNSNVQGINNSIVYDSSSVCHDPGVHLTLYAKPTVGGFHVE